MFSETRTGIQPSIHEELFLKKKLVVMGAVVNEEAFCLKWNDFHTSLTSTFTELRAESDLLDATIFCEGKEIRGVMFCHLAVLVYLHGEVKVRRAVRVAVQF